MTKDEALKLALEALEMFCEHGAILRPIEIRDAIKQAIAAPPMHKPVRWADEEYREISDQVISTLVEYGAELRTADCQMQILREELAESRREVAQLKAQRQWAGLTDEEKRQIFEREDYQGWLDYINAIEAKLKERNT